MAPSGPATMSSGATALAETWQLTVDGEDEHATGLSVLGENLNTPEASSVNHRLPSGPSATSWGCAPLPAPGPTPAANVLRAGVAPGAADAGSS
jgi:hypothetical protein